jgi:hypothetical protein
MPKTYSLHAEPGRLSLAGGATTLTVVRYPDVLLKTARTFVKDGHHDIAVVVAHMAAEVAAERVMRAAFEKLSIPALAQPVFDLLSGYNLGNDRVRKLYAALTGDDINARKFWHDFKQSAERRNRVVHEGHRPKAGEAEQSIEAVQALLWHLDRRR